MILQNKELYEFYTFINKEKADKEITKVQKLSKTKIDLIAGMLPSISLLKQIFPEIETKLEDLLYKPYSINNLGDTSFKRFALEDFNKNYKQIVEINNILNETTETITIVNSKIFCYVLKQFNIMLAEEMIKGYVFKINSLGAVKVVNKKRRGLNIDWDASNKFKAELEAKGIIPYKKVGIDEEGNAIGNGGTKWMITHNECFEQWFDWDRVGCVLRTDDRFPLFPYYNLIVNTGTKNGPARKLRKATKNDKFAKLKFD